MSQNLLERILVSYLWDEYDYDAEEISLLLEMMGYPLTRKQYVDLDMKYWFGQACEHYSVGYRARKILDLISD